MFQGVYVVIMTSCYVSRCVLHVVIMTSCYVSRCVRCNNDFMLCFKVSSCNNDFMLCFKVCTL